MLTVKTEIKKPFDLKITGSKPFTENTLQNGTLYVPYGTKEIYSRLDGWRSFHNIQEVMSDDDLKYLTLDFAGNGKLKEIIELGKAYSYCIIPDEGWAINTVLFNGQNVTSELTSENVYTTPKISNNSVLSVSFEKATPQGIISQSQSKIQIYSVDGKIYVKNANIGSLVQIFDTTGKLIINDTINSSDTSINLEKDYIYIVKVEDKIVKVAL